jgi:hypothetical protein
MKPWTLVATLTLALLLMQSASRADIPPTCSTFDDRVTCAQADLGKACPSGGTCYEVSCAATAMGGQQKLYKCEVCPNVIDAGTCSMASGYGAPCADDAGTCRKAPAWCGSIGFACLGPNPELAPVVDASAGAGGAGGTTNATGGNGGAPSVAPATANDSGCSCSALGASRRAALPAFLLGSGALALLLDRARRRGRRER